MAIKLKKTKKVRAAVNKREPVQRGYKELMEILPVENVKNRKMTRKACLENTLMVLKNMKKKSESVEALEEAADKASLVATEDVRGIYSHLAVKVDFVDSGSEEGELIVDLDDESQYRDE